MISSRKFIALTQLKFKTMMNANIIFGPAFAIALTAVLRVVYSKIFTGEDMPAFLMTMLLNLGLSFNIGMTGIFVISAMLAEEKESNTLRVLMTSSVTSTEFLLASILPPISIMIAVNMLLIPISGISIGGANIIIYFFITTISSIICCMIGIIIGIYSKNQVNASTLSVPILVIVTILPTFANFFPFIENVMRFLFIGTISKMIEMFTMNNQYKLDILDIIILLINFMLAFAVFIYVYRKNGFERD